VLSGTSRRWRPRTPARAVLVVEVDGLRKSHDASDADFAVPRRRELAAFRSGRVGSVSGEGDLWPGRSSAFPSPLPPGEGRLAGPAAAKRKFRASPASIQRGKGRRGRRLDVKGARRPIGFTTLARSRTSGTASGASWVRLAGFAGRLEKIGVEYSLKDASETGGSWSMRSFRAGRRRSRCLLMIYAIGRQLHAT
jgi:hypothetical protein